MHRQSHAVIALLGLAPHPEGGFYRETFRSPRSVGAPHAARAASTAIYFLLPAGEISVLHRVLSDEVWHHYDGDAVELHLFVDGGHQVERLGRDLARGERPQRVVPAGVLQGAVAVGPRHALCGCTVAPGFDFADFESPDRMRLLDQMPAHRAVIERLTRG